MEGMIMKKFMLALMLVFLIPTFVFASSGSSAVGIEVAIIMEAFISVHMSLFVLAPLSKIISEENNKKIFWILFAIRAIFLLFFDFYITPNIAIIDFVAVFFGAGVVLPIAGIKSSKEKLKYNVSQPNDVNVELKCKNCGREIMMDRLEFMKKLKKVIVNEKTSN